MCILCTHTQCTNFTFAVYICTCTQWRCWGVMRYCPSHYVVCSSAHCLSGGPCWLCSDTATRLRGQPRGSQQQVITLHSPTDIIVPHHHSLETCIIYTLIIHVCTLSSTCICTLCTHTIDIVHVQCAYVMCLLSVHVHEAVYWMTLNLYCCVLCTWSSLHNIWITLQ